MTSALLVLVFIGGMIVLAPAVFAPGRTGMWARLVAPWIALPVLVVALAGPDTAPFHPPWLFSGSLIGLDDVGRVFLIAASALWTAAGVYARSYIPAIRRASFLFFFLMSMAGNLLLPIAADIVTFYTGFALMTMAGYGLITHIGGSRANRAGRIYLFMAVVGEMFLLTGILLTAAVAGTTALEEVPAAIGRSPWINVIMLCLVGGFGLKSGVVPLHVWLPLAHPVAPTPASAVLSGSMIKAGILGWIRFLPLGHVTLPEWGVAAVIVGGGAALFGAGAGVLQRELKTILAYSSVSQIGLMNAALGIGLLAPLAAPAAIAGVTLYAAHHSLTKGALFLGVGVLERRPPGSRARAWIIAGMLFPAVALAGVPFSSGGLAKGEIGRLIETASASAFPWLDWLLPVSAFATTLLMARFIAVLIPRELAAERMNAADAGREAATGTTPHGAREFDASLWVPWVVLAVVAIVALYFDPLWEPVAGSREQALPDLEKTVHGLLPIGAGVILAAIATLLWRRLRSGHPAPAIEPGDILVPFENTLKRFPWRGRIPAGDSGEAVMTRLADAWYRHYSSSQPGDRLLRQELRITRWSSGAALLLGVTVVMLVLLVAGRRFAEGW